MVPELTAKLSAAQASATPHQRGLHGACWTKFLLSLLRFVPRWVALIWVRPVTWLIYLSARRQRQPLLSNLKALHPEFSALRLWWAGYEVFLQFALTYLDRLWHMHFRAEIEWDVPERARFETLKQTPGGVLIFTIHSGNYDIGASLFAERFGRILNIVRVPEQTEALQQLREAELRHCEQQHPHLRVHYNQVDNHLGLELCRLLMAGEAVAVQGDRVVSSISPMQVMHEGVEFCIPRGPLVLAEIARKPCYPIFLERLSCLKYRIHVGECFYDGQQKLRAADVAQRWLPVLHRHIRQHWRQWFVFEPLLRR
jgi:predicted LPLAT superfamily acyltransferase